MSHIVTHSKFTDISIRDIDTRLILHGKHPPRRIGDRRVRRTNTYHDNEVATPLCERYEGAR